MGKGTPTFAGIQSLMDHLVEHRENLPSGEVLYRMNCLVGRQATLNEDFDINLISPEAGRVSPSSKFSGHVSQSLSS